MFPRLTHTEGIAPVTTFPEYPGRPGHATYNKFSKKDQLIDVTSDAHKFIAPGPNDIRGPCAGLNAAANHGYIPRNGIATSQTIMNGLWDAFHLDHTATIFLETATRFFDGNPLTGEWSIGYASSETNLAGDKSLLGTPTGICDYGHLKTEGDASITRGDCKYYHPSMYYYPQPLTFIQSLHQLATITAHHTPCSWDSCSPSPSP